LLAGVVVIAACGHAPPRPAADLCDAANADPNACLAVAEERLALHDEAGMRESMDKLVNALNASPACLRDHDARGCFAGVVALLREHPVGLLAPYDLAEDLLDFAPRWTGSDATGPRAQARTALQGMCTTTGRDPIAQQRACLVLGDLVQDERNRRCGLDCDPAAEANRDALQGWGPSDVIDGYAAACKVDHAHVPALDYDPFAAEVAHVYHTPKADPVCGAATSSRRGASIPDALAARDRMEIEARAKAASSENVAKREAARLIAMEKAKAEAAKRAAIADQAAFDSALMEAIHRSDWAVTYGLLTKRRGGSIGDAATTALNKIFEPFSDWTIAQSNGSVAAAYLALSSRLVRAPKNHAIRVSLATLRDRALVEAKASAKRARGLGATWLHAALVARIAGPLFPDEQKVADAAWTKLVTATRASLEIQNLSPACTPLVPAPPAGTKATVKAKSTLECTLLPERRFTAKEPFKVKQHVVTNDGEQDVEAETMIDVTHRTFQVAVHGVIAIYAGAPRRAVPIDFEEIVDDTRGDTGDDSADGSDAHTYEAAVAAARDLITRSTVGAIETATADKAYAAGRAALKVGRKDAAENWLVIHGLIAGSSAELDDLMVNYGITFGDLLPPR
jgi:hypothetical protein